MRFIHITLAGLCLLLFCGATANAQTAAMTGAGVSVDRGADELGDAVRIRPDAPDRDFVDTALIFTNLADQRNGVRCVARNANGRIIGSAYTVVPGKGLRFILASDMAEGADFAGSVECQTTGRLVGTALLLGPSGVTDLPSRRISLDGPIGISFPVVATR